MRKLDRFVMILFSIMVIMIPLYLIVTFSALDMNFYMKQYEKNNTGYRTNMTTEQLKECTEMVLGYMYGDVEEFSYIIEPVDGSAPYDAFIKEDKVHMADVLQLLKNIDAIVITMTIIYVLGLIYIIWRYMYLKERIFSSFLWGMVIVLGIVVLIFIGGTILYFIDVSKHGRVETSFFDVFWEYFHHLIFWDIDKFNNAFLPYRSNLIRLVDSNFFEAMVIKIALIYVSTLVLIYGSVFTLHKMVFRKA